MRVLLVLVVLMGLTLVGCSDGARGYVLDDQGGGPDTPERARARSERQLTQALADAGITAQVQITETPSWSRRHRRAEPTWLFADATVTVTTADADPDHLVAIITEVMQPALPAHVHPTVITETVPTPAPTDAQAAPDTSAATTYVLQAGDTLAEISAAFYGSSQHWRRLLDANPGLDANRLTVGQTIVIPPKPE